MVAKRVKAAKPGIEAGVFPALRSILHKVSPDFTVHADTEVSFYLNCRKATHNKKPLFFAAAMRKKNYVSFHLFPIYIDPGMQAKVSPGLAKRQQGKACFNFAATDEGLFLELAALVRDGVELYRVKGWA